MSPERIQAIRAYRENTRSGDDLPDVKYAHEAIDELLDEIDCLNLAQFSEAKKAQQLPLRPSSTAALPSAGSTKSIVSGSITRLVSASLFNNSNPWVATCGGCQQLEEFGYGTITLPQTMTDRGWLLMNGFGWVCPKCQQKLASVSL